MGRKQFLHKVYTRHVDDKNIMLYQIICVIIQTILGIPYHKLVLPNGSLYFREDVTFHVDFIIKLINLSLDTDRDPRDAEYNGPLSDMSTFYAHSSPVRFRLPSAKQVYGDVA